MFHSNRLLIPRDQRTGSGEGRKQKHRALAGPDAKRYRGRWPRHQSLQWSGSVEGLSGDQIAVGIKSGSHSAVGLLQAVEVLQACRFIQIGQSSMLRRRSLQPRPLLRRNTWPISTPRDADVPLNSFADLSRSTDWFSRGSETETSCPCWARCQAVPRPMAPAPITPTERVS